LPTTGVPSADIATIGDVSVAFQTTDVVVTFMSPHPAALAIMMANATKDMLLISFPSFFIFF
jgi:hypothetical protein